MPGFVKTNNTLIFVWHFQVVLGYLEVILGYLEVHKSEIHLAKNSVHFQLIPTVASIAGIPLAQIQANEPSNRGIGIFSNWDDCWNLQGIWEMPDESQPKSANDRQ